MPYKDPERRREYGREWIKRNPDKAREAMRKWREAHPDAHRAEGRAYYARDPERRKQQINASPNRNAVRRTMHQRRRARSIQAPGSHTAKEWTALVAAYGGKCAYCKAIAPLHEDHRVPLSRGGSNSIDNILPACARCNLRKASRTEVEFRAFLAAERRRKPSYT